MGIHHSRPDPNASREGKNADPEDVKKAQAILKAHDPSVKLGDSRYGPKTKGAIKAYLDTKPDGGSFDKMTPAETKTYLAQVQAKIKDHTASPQELAAAKHIMMDNAGFNLQGASNGRIDKAITAYGKMSDKVIQKRNDFYKNIKIGKDGTRYVEVTRNGVTKKITFKSTFNKNEWDKKGIGLNTDIRMTKFSTYEALMNAMFKTKDLQGVYLSGGYRPPPETGRPGAHPTGRGLDIASIVTTSGTKLDYKESAVKNGSAATNPQNAVLKDFARNIVANGNVNQVISPYERWQTWKSPNTGYSGPSSTWQTNNGQYSVEQLHWDHLHFGLNNTPTINNAW